MEENKIVKHEGGIIKHVSNAIKISNKLIQESEVANSNDFSETIEKSLENPKTLPVDQQSKNAKKIAALKIVHDYLMKKKKKEDNEK